MGFDLDGRAHFAAGKHLHRRTHAGETTGIDVVERDLALAGKGFQQAIQVDDVIGHLEQEVLDAMLGQTTLQGHLSALETGADAAAGTGILALVALARRAAKAGTGAAAHTTAGFALFRKRKEIVQLHDLYSSGPVTSRSRQPGAKRWR